MKGESLAAMPDALLKNIVSPHRSDSLSVTQEHESCGDYDDRQIQTTVSRNEQITGLEFKL